VRSRTGLIALITVVLVAAAACGPGTAGRSGSSAAPPSADHHVMRAVHAMRLVAATAAQAPSRQVRAQFEQLLGLHALVAVRQMRSVVAAAPELQRATEASLQANTRALGSLVAEAYGSAQAGPFTPLWQRHLVDLMAYAKAVAGKDASAGRSARALLLADADAYGSWLAEASTGQVQADDAAAGVRLHVTELMEQADAYAARDYQQAYQIERAAYEHMFTAGTALAKASVTPEVAVGLETPPERLRSAFAMLLGEHLELIVDAQRATFAGQAEFEAAAAQVNANTTALTKAMAGIVGPDKAAEFQTAWANHVEGLMAYTAAVAGNDETDKTVATQNLEGFAERLALYFSDVVKNLLAADPLTDALTAHDQHLIDQVDAYAAKRYDQAQEMELEGYQQMLGVANTLVGAIQRTVKPKLPVGGSKTGGGGMAVCRRP
jgi:phage terminase Nu1 subunit (DNA packaging protein)